MQTANGVHDEEGRLAALRSFDILDTPRERDFDEVASLASAICGTPIAVVNLIGAGRQFFKAEVGLGVRETPLESSFCAKAILEEEFLVVPDATKDARFDCNPLVAGEPGLRFYAGALLKTEDGHAIGTVCVLDFVPHELTLLQQQTLRVLARQVMRQLELRRAIQERDKARTQQRVLNLELVHRLKNTLALVQAISQQTLKDVTERDAVKAFERRLLALGRAHDTLSRESWSAASVSDVIEGAASLHDRGRFDIEGPEIIVGPKATLSLSLLVHELATNATKHGSLSAPHGTVRVSWSVQADDVGPELVLRWEELGGPTPMEPSKGKGFGSRLIRMGLIGTGGTEVCYLPSGLLATFKAPMSAVVAT